MATALELDELVEHFTLANHELELLRNKTNARADKKVTKELLAELRRVTGKETILFHMAEAAVDHPDQVVRDALFPVVPGGEATLS